MRDQLLELLACPECGAPLELAKGQPDEDGEVETGELRCASHGHSFAIVRGVPRFVPTDLSSLERHTADAFGWQWTHFREMHDEFEGQFRDWIEPLDRSSFEGKAVLDAGCGIGRHSYFAASWGASTVVALDLSDAVETARETMRPFPGAHVVQGDLLRPPFPEPGVFDLAYSIGVLHHLPDPAAAFRSVVGTVRPGGIVAVWVYGWEGNGFVRHVVEPVRRLTTRMSPSALRAVAYPLAAAFNLTAKGVYRPLRGTRLGRALPMRSYLTSVSEFSFRQNYTIVYDQLVAPSSAYIRRREIERWFAEGGLEDVEITARNGNSWRGHGRVPDRS